MAGIKNTSSRAPSVSRAKIKGNAGKLGKTTGVVRTATLTHFEARALQLSLKPAEPQTRKGNLRPTASTTPGRPTPVQPQGPFNQPPVELAEPGPLSRKGNDKPRPSTTGGRPTLPQPEVEAPHVPFGRPTKFPR
ncbi:MAG: hypothetical protein ACO1OB_21965 [Archangium sp.]